MNRGSIESALQSPCSTDLSLSLIQWMDGWLDGWMDACMIGYEGEVRSPDLLLITGDGLFF